MLMLIRKTGESIRIADDIYLTVMSNNGEEITLGFDAPNSIEILREEIYRLKNRKKNKVLNRAPENRVFERVLGGLR